MSRQARYWNDLLGEHGDKLRATLDVESLEELRELVADGVRATSQLLGNVGVTLTLTQ
jgi:hypothetical protein